MFTRVFICILLVAASFFDFRSRKVPDMVWALFMPIGLALTLTSIALNGWDIREDIPCGL